MSNTAYLDTFKFFGNSFFIIQLSTGQVQNRKYNTIVFYSEFVYKGYFLHVYCFKYYILRIEFVINNFKKNPLF